MKKLIHKEVKSLESWDLKLNSKPQSLSGGLTTYSLKFQQTALAAC